MATTMQYSDILANILERKHSQCNCSTYLTGLEIQKPNITGGCQFGSYCQFSASCNYNKAKCTCYPRCTCAPDNKQLMPTRENGPSGVCSEPNCVCVGTCLCQSEDSIINKHIYQPTTNCNKANCICSVCLCQNHDISDKNIFPSYFRKSVKTEALMSDEMMKKECAEIKQLLDEHQEKLRKELPHEKLSGLHDNESKSISFTPIKDGEKIPSSAATSRKSKAGEKTSSTPGVIEPSKEKGRKSLVVSVDEKLNSITPAPISKTSKSKSCKRDDKSNRKEKPVQRKHPRPHSAKTQCSTIYRQSKTSEKIKPLRIRYYYSGGTEHYGVKLGHKFCLERLTLVPKHMGWLWNIEDPSKSIRERKGWPPGFIGKNIKNMMKVMKRAEEGLGLNMNLSENKPDVRERWKTLPYKAEEKKIPLEESPLLHIHKKGRTYNITFCPKNSDEDLGPIPIPFTITEKKQNSDSETTDSSLEFELHSPKPRGKCINRQVQQEQIQEEVKSQRPLENDSGTVNIHPSTTKQSKKKVTRRRSKGSEVNKILWEEQQTQIQNID